MAKPIPDGYHSVTPYLYVRGAADAIAFWTKAFGASERMRMPGPEGAIMHAEIIIGNSMVMLADEMPAWGNKSPQTLGGTSAGFCIYIPDVDLVYERAVAAGAKIVRPIANQFYGDRSATLEDPFGHVWTVATHVEDLTDEEIARRAEALMKAQ